MSPHSMHSQLLPLFHLIKAELLLPSVQGSDVWNLAVITSTLFQPCFNVATSSTGAWEDTRRPPSWNLRTLIPLQGSIMRRYAILLLGPSSSFKSPLPISMRKQCPACSTIEEERQRFFRAVRLPPLM